MFTKFHHCRLDLLDVQFLIWEFVWNFHNHHDCARAMHPILVCNMKHVTLYLSTVCCAIRLVLHLIFWKYSFQIVFAHAWSKLFSFYSSFSFTGLLTSGIKVTHTNMYTFPSCDKRCNPIDGRITSMKKKPHDWMTWATKTFV
jgi:hypothetical protein